MEIADLVDFSGTDVAAIENALEAQRPGGWRRLAAATLAEYASVAPRAGWELMVPAGQFRCAAIDRLRVLIDAAFPDSDPRVAAPQLDIGDWAHVEPRGLLCLTKRTWQAASADRVLQSLVDAAAVLDMDVETQQQEYFAEFSAYWSQRLTPESPLFMTLVANIPGSRELFYYRQANRGRIVLADNRGQLVRWLEHTGVISEARSLRRTQLIWLPQPWAPHEFPELAKDVRVAAEPVDLNGYLLAGEALPVLFGVQTRTGLVFVGTDLPGVPRSRFKKGGFRDLSKIPGTMLATMSAGLRVARCRVERVDRAWIYGRDHDPMQASLATKRVGLVGCGALGGAIARLLVQMGVGRWLLIDGDGLSAPNTARHVLGNPYIRVNKGVALRRELLIDFPHIESIESFPVEVRELTDSQRDSLSQCDVIVSAGISWAGDLVLDQWRQSLPLTPVHVCSWVEEFALAGHAVALIGEDTLRSQFSADGVPDFRLTSWPTTVATQIMEAGCGNLFQPLGAVDLINSAALAAQLVVDVLVGEVKVSCRRVWLGDRTRLAQLGGTPAAQFDMSHARREFPWLDRAG
jgi:hypothetical protein